MDTLLFFHWQEKLGQVARLKVDLHSTVNPRLERLRVQVKLPPNDQVETPRSCSKHAFQMQRCEGFCDALWYTRDPLPRTDQFERGVTVRASASFLPMSLFFD
jgi:hypothetical protein